MILLDGATGTELGRRGVDTRSVLFSAAALVSEAGVAALRTVHADYVRAGAQVITANTFRTNPRKAGARWRELAELAMRTGSMRSGDELGAFFRDARGAGAQAALINCVPCDGVDAGLGAAAASGLPFGAYAHMGDVDPEAGWPPTPILPPEAYAQ